MIFDGKILSIKPGIGKIRGKGEVGSINMKLSYLNDNFKYCETDIEIRIRALGVFFNNYNNIKKYGYKGFLYDTTESKSHIKIIINKIENNSIVLILDIYNVENDSVEVYSTVMEYTILENFINECKQTWEVL